MARSPSPEIDDELFNEVYGKEYTGPPKPTTDNVAVHTTKKRTLLDDNPGEVDEAPDPNAVPTDFTSREARVWEAKAKATERIWKKKKEEEMICKLCGESGHFTQGCPSTLGTNRKSADFFERVAARDKRVRDLFSQKVTSQIEKDIGCKLKMEEKFLIVSGKDRLVLAKGVDAVHKIIQDGGKGKSNNSPSTERTRSKSPDRNPTSLHHKRSDSQRSHSSPRNRRADSQRSHSPRNVRSDAQRAHSSPRAQPRLHARVSSEERRIEDRVREDLQQLSRNSASQAYDDDRARGVPARSRTPPGHTSFGHNHTSGMHKTDNLNVEKYGDIRPTYPQTSEELEIEFKREDAEIQKARDKEEDEENQKHREYMMELKEDYMKKLTILRATHSKQWEEFLKFDSQRRQQTQYNAYNQPAYPEYKQYPRDAHYGGNNFPMDSRSGPPYPCQDYPPSYGDYDRTNHDARGRTYGR